jgi:AcrR family transcriptional regulator
MAARGSYNKGIAKREEILATALRVIAEKGYGRTSIRQLADAVGLTQTGLLHYFSSKEELFAEVLRARDAVDQAAFERDESTPPTNLIDGYTATIRHNSEVPGLVQLYTRLSAEATDEDSAAREFFQERYNAARAQFARMIAEMQAAGQAPTQLDADTMARILIALSDGLQTQWLIQPDFDMAETITALWGALGTPPAAAGPVARSANVAG